MIVYILTNILKWLWNFNITSNKMFSKAENWLINSRENSNCLKNRRSYQRCSTKKGVLKNFAKFTGKDLCQSLFLNKEAGLRQTLLTKETQTQVFSCEFCEISQYTFSYRTPLVATSAPNKIFWSSGVLNNNNNNNCHNNSNWTSQDKASM